MSNIRHLYPPVVDGMFQETMEGQLNTIVALFGFEIEKLEQLYVERGGSLEGHHLTISRINDPNQEPTVDDPMEFLTAYTARLQQMVKELQALK